LLIAAQARFRNKRNGAARHICRQIRRRIRHSVGFESDQGRSVRLAAGGFPDKVVKAVLRKATSGAIKIERLYELTR
jgi:hypothetical protein